MLEDYLLPNEEIKWAGPQLFYGNELFNIYITNRRLLLYQKRGFSFLKKENVISEKIRDIQNITLRQEGFISKQGILTIDMPNRRIQLKGSIASIKATYQTLMMYWEND